MIEGRELLWDIIEAVTGARVTISYTRIGGVTQRLHPRHAGSHPQRASSIVRALLGDCDKLLTRNRIFYDRMADIGIMSQADAISYGADRAAAARHRRQLRRAQGAAVLRATSASTSTCRWAPTATTTIASWCASRRCEQSIRIVEQALRELPDGPVRIDDPRFVLPEKHERLQQHRRPDAPLQADHGRRQGPAGRSLSGRRRRQRRARLLRRQRRQRSALSRAACARRASSAWPRWAT